MQQALNFNAGPSTLPAEVMKEAQASFLNYNDLGCSIIEASHRSAEFQTIIDKAENNIRSLMSISDDYAVLFLQGGASAQFAMIPMNLMSAAGSSDYACTGSWSEKAIAEARLFGDVRIIATSKDDNYSRIPDTSQWNVDKNSAYLHITSNNTIFGTQYHAFPSPPNTVPLIADMSSDIMSRKINVNDFGLIYAGAQKNIGPSGVTLVIIRKDLADRVSESTPKIFKYSTHIKGQSLYNTPPTFAIYMISLVSEWMVKSGGIAGIETLNDKKAAALYGAIDEDDFYSCPAEKSSRSKMNVCFRLPTEDLEKLFLTEAASRKMMGLKGHRSVGGCRASIYNAMPLEGVNALIDFMTEFRAKNGQC